MTSFNQTILQGTVKEVASYTDKKGCQITKIYVRTTRKVRDKVFSQSHRCIAYGSKAELAANILEKGDSIFIQGHNETKVFTTDGKPSYLTSIVIDFFIKNNSKSNSEELEADDVFDNETSCDTATDDCVGEEQDVGSQRKHIF